MQALARSEFSKAHIVETSLPAAITAGQSRGWSLIPLIGGAKAESGKRARLAWKRFTRRHPSDRELQGWFQQAEFAYGVICGEISRLIVIDFDANTEQMQFLKKYPQLAQTFLVESGFRRTLHFYFEVDFPVQSRNLRGADLKGEGSYVVGAGSQIAGAQWNCIQDLPAYKLSKQELDAILQDFDLERKVQQDVTSGPVLNAEPGDFQALYQKRLRQTGERNNSLFYVACQMRDAGFSYASAEASLLDMHVQQPAYGKRPDSESPLERASEGRATLASVFSRGPRLPISRANQTERELGASYLPNALREALLQEAHGTAFLRVYEALLLLGKTETDSLSETEILNLIRPYGIGRHSLRQALQFCLAPSPKPSPSATADLTFGEQTTKTCVFVPRTKSNKSPSSRPAQYYGLPSVEALSSRLGIKAKAADPIYLSDLCSVKAYRAALERELVRRRPDKYHLNWLGQRLQVSRRSIQRYHLQEGVQSRQILHETPLFWGNLNLIPQQSLAKRAGLPWRAYFLQDDRGKRYPPLRSIAESLLAKKRSVSLMQRDIKQYWLGEERHALLSTASHNLTGANTPLVAVLGQGIAPEASLAQNSEHDKHKGFVSIKSESCTVLAAREIEKASEQAVLECSSDELDIKVLLVVNEAAEFQSAKRTVAKDTLKDAELMDTRSADLPGNDRHQAEQPGAKRSLGTEISYAKGSNAPREAKRNANKKTSKWPSYKDAMPDILHEWFAQRLHREARSLQLADARQLVQLYGMKVMGKALGRMIYLRDNGSLDNAAGFLIDTARSFWYAANGFEKPAPRFERLKRRQGRGSKKPDSKQD